MREITDLVHRAGALAVVDGVCFCPHGLPDVAALGADIYLFSLYKVYGPHVGAMYVRKALAEQLPSQAHFFKGNALAGRFTPAGPDHPQVAAINGVIDYMEAVASRHGYAALRSRGAPQPSGSCSATTSANDCSHCSIFSPAAARCA